MGFLSLEYTQQMLNDIEIHRLREAFQVIQFSFMLIIPIIYDMGSVGRSIIVLEVAVTFGKPSLAYWMRLVSQNDQVIFAVHPTMQGNNKLLDQENSIATWLTKPLLRLFSVSLHCREKASLG